MQSYILTAVEPASQPVTGLWPVTLLLASFLSSWLLSDPNLSHEEAEAGDMMTGEVTLGFSVPSGFSMPIFHLRKLRITEV